MSEENLPAPERSWSYGYDDKNMGRTEITIQVTSTGVHWNGDCWNPNWGGPFGIGSQSLQDFLTNGPIAGYDIGGDMAAEIREHIELHFKNK